MPDPAEEKQGGEAQKSGSVIKDVASFMTDWKVTVAAIAAATSLWFSVTEQYNKDLKINQEALAFASKQEAMARFWLDPPNMINQIETSYPRHAFCSVLGFYVAEVARSERGKTLTGETTINPDDFREANDAVSAEIEQIAENHGVSLCALKNTAYATGANLVALDGPDADGHREPGEDGEACEAAPALDYCTAVRADPGLVTRLRVHQECTLAMNAFAENICTSYAAVRREQLKTRRQQQSASVRQAEVARFERLGQTAMVVDPVNRQMKGPSLCGGEPVRIYLQAGSKSVEVRKVRQRLLDAGWQMTAIDQVKVAPDAGDVRYYFPEQARCADALARDAATALGEATPLATTSLSGAYKSLPRGRMELWLP